MSAYAYSVVLEELTADRTFRSFHTVGYAYVASADEARGVAVRESFAKRPAASIVSVAVVEILPESAE